ncbi:DUF2441 domain-containing protein, partial [Mycobacterium montefiorense]|uniref:DUF2441 domain-containing protein n=1 Tax=Mycobacterium montefiorense TaxID=154654 RepID=UPI0021C3A70A
MSRHGAWYLAGNADLSFGFELVWELVRKNQFSDCPSRLTSIFAFSDPSAAGQFARTDDRPRTTWEIEAPDDTRSFDMHWIRGASIGVAMANAAMYWSGAASPTPG